MTALPPVAEAAIAAVLVFSMGRAFFGTTPPRADVVASGAWMVAALLLLGTVLLSDGDALWRLVLSVGGVEAACVAGWWLRGGSDEPGDGGGEDPILPPPDWDEFDRARRGWDRPRALS
jgi:hypothetical protein